MWMATTLGFYSAVQNSRDTTGQTLQVRTRARKDADTLRDWIKREHGVTVEVLRWEGRDYPWRLIVDRQIWGSFLVWLSEDMDYTNFKDAVGKVNKPRASIYGRVWGVLCDIENEDGKLKRKSQWPTSYRTTSTSSGWKPQTLSDLLQENHGLPLLPQDLDDLEEDQGAAAYRSIHEMTDDEFQEFMAEGGLSVIDEEPPVAPRPRNTRRDRGGRKNRRG